MRRPPFQTPKPCSNPNIEYETLQYLDGTTSCNCKGWTRRVAPDGSRWCKHTRLVDITRKIMAKFESQGDLDFLFCYAAERF